MTDICAAPVALKRPTNPDSANESSASSTHMDATLMPASQSMQTSGAMLSSNGALTPGPSGTMGGGALPSGGNANSGNDGNNSSSNNVLGGINYGADNYDFFDPQHWMLDGLLDFNYSFVPPMEGA